MKARSAFMYVATASALLLLEPSPAAAQECRWDGTAPFCSGECGGDETEITRLDAIPDFWEYPMVGHGPEFGQPCWTGSKALCCKTPGRTCRWDGTAPFCEGACSPGERPETPQQSSHSGAGCWTGSKVYCCRSTGPNVVRSPLEKSPEITRYAALWEKQDGPVWQARHGLSAADYQQTFDALVAQGYRPVEVNGYAVGGEATYAVIFEQRQDRPWVARHGLTAERHQEEFDRLSREGYRMVDVSGYEVGGADLFASIWEQRDGPAWSARHGLSAARFQEEFDRFAREGYRLIDVSGYAIGDEDRYAAIWERSEGPAWAARHGLTSAQYQQEFNALAANGHRLVRISGWRSGREAHYAAIWELVGGPAWGARHGMVSDAYQEEFFQRAGQGYRLKRVSGYHVGE